MAEPISSFRELKAALKALPKPPRGTIRVYRGQNNDYPTLLPSGLRRSISKQVIWSTYSHILYQSLLPEALQASDNVTVEMLKAYGLWFHAVAQHYGPGSDYLDVSHSIEMALWFALNEYGTGRVHGIIGPPGPPDPDKDHPTAGELVRYRPWNEPGYLYVFDLPKWDGDRLAEVGMLIDVADAPEIFSSSLRMRAQEACLVYCRAKKGEAHLDMKTRLVPGTPIKIQRPMTGAAGLDRTVSELFPSPEKDPWYARLLSVPMSYSPEPAPPRIRRCIPVAVYSDELNSSYDEEVHFRDVMIQPPLLHRWVRQLAQTSGSDEFKLVAEAVPIILEAAMLFPYPPAGSSMWHHGLLASDLPDRCHSYNLETALPDGELDLTNVLFEFSPLERPGWERNVSENAPVNLLRGVWIYRAPGANEFNIGLIFQDVPGTGPNSFPEFRLVYDESAGELLLALNPDEAPIPIRPGSEVTQHFGKPAIVALMLLRHLSPALKAEASARGKFGIEEDGEDKFKFLVNCSRDIARLFRVVSDSQDDWFVMRDSANPEEPFTHSRDPAGMLEFTTKNENYDIPIEEIRGPLAGSGM